MIILQKLKSYLKSDQENLFVAKTKTQESRDIVLLRDQKKLFNAKKTRSEV